MTLFNAPVLTARHLAAALCAGLLSCTLSATAAEFSVAAENGSLHSRDYAGKVLFVDFWASWCAPCQKSFPWMNEMQSKYGKDGFQVIAINVDKARKDSVGFLQKVEASFPIGYDPEGKLAEQFDVMGMPSSFILGRNGELISKHIGFRDDKTDDYEAHIRAALAH